jgi:glutathione S-transferase
MVNERRDNDMSREIGFDALNLDYVSIADAREMSGLRLVLGAYPVPGPWRESCRGLFYVKGLSYTAVRSANDPSVEFSLGADGAQSELMTWTAQSSAPVAIWNDERPRSLWNDQLNLAERLNPEPRLIPADFDARVRMFGLINEIAGENGFAWSKRVLMSHGPLQSLPAGDAGRVFWEVLAAKYGYSAAAAEVAIAHIVNILTQLDAQLAAQQTRRNQYMMGAELSALDIYWACFCGVLDPLPEDLCPMATAYRPSYSPGDPAIVQALTTRLLKHRDFIYEKHLQLPIVF